MTRLNQQELELQVTSLLAEAIGALRTGITEPKWKDFQNSPGDRRLHYPEPYDDGQPSSYDLAMERYHSQLAARKAAEQAEAEARELVSKHPLIRVRICEALKSVNDDAKDLAKIVCAALIPLSIAGTIALPLTPLLCLGVGLVVWRAGTNGFCSGLDQSKK